ncbi:hypothetical protein D3C86_1657710 [compost metagenome]
MRVTALVQLEVGLLHGVGDPGAVGVFPWRGASADNRGEIPVEGHLVALLAQQFVQAARDMQFVGKQNGARVRRPPEDRLAFRKPGKAAMAISLDQPIGGQVATRCQQPVGVAHGLFQWREGQGVAL